MPNQKPQNIHLSLSQYRYLYCVDLEATCDDLMPGEPSRGLVVTPEEMETIEFGLVVIDQRERRVVGRFQSFVRPRLHPQLTPFCRQLTTIEQCDIDSAPGFLDAMQRLNNFASGYAGAAWLSWGKYDATQIHRDGAINQTSSLLESIPPLQCAGLV